MSLKNVLFSLSVIVVGFGMSVTAEAGGHRKCRRVCKVRVCQPVAYKYYYRTSCTPSSTAPVAPSTTPDVAPPAPATTDLYNGNSGLLRTAPGRQRSSNPDADLDFSAFPRR